MEHQDWTPVILSKNRKYTEEENQKYEQKKQEKLEKKKNEENEVKAPPKINFELKKAIMQARLAKKMSQKDVATKLNVTLSTIQGYENGKIVPNNQFIVKLERLFGTKLPRIKKN